ncbi:MAG: hypothetical protein Q4F95_08855 [Oscillospiraceae bacterium]|nr:hypothetical protein [Oscillospiraceae bacterium]
MGLTFWKLISDISLILAAVFVLSTIVLIIRFKIFSLLRFEISSKKHEKNAMIPVTQSLNTVTSEVRKNLSADIPVQEYLPASDTATSSDTVTGSVRQSTGTVISGQSIPGGTVIAGASPGQQNSDNLSNDFVILKNIIIIHSDPKIIG